MSLQSDPNGNLRTAPQCNNVINIAQTATTDVHTFTGYGYICSVILVSATAENIGIDEGTGTTCETSGTALIGVSSTSAATAQMALAANGGFSSVASVSWLRTQTSADICVSYKAARARSRGRSLMRIWRIKMLCAIANRLIAAAIVIFVPCLLGFSYFQFAARWRWRWRWRWRRRCRRRFHRFGDLSGHPTIDDYFRPGIATNPPMPGIWWMSRWWVMGGCLNSSVVRAAGSLVSKSGASLASTISTCRVVSTLRPAS